jgi:hypothetical protein
MNKKQSQSAKIKLIVDELVLLRHEYDIRQAAIRTKLHDLFGDGPPLAQRQVVKDLIDMFLFPEE